MLSYYPVFILLAPLAAGLIIGLFGRALGPKLVRLGIAADVIALVLAISVLFEVSGGGTRTLQLFVASDGLFQIGLRLDRLAAVMLVHIAAISLLIQLFSIRYMQEEPGHARFHSLLGFITFVLFGMVSSGNLLMIFVFWQLLSWLVPLLSHNYAHAPTARGVFRTFIMHRFGDTAFLAGIILAATIYGTLDLQDLFVRAAETQTMFALWLGGPEVHANTLVCLLIFIGAMSKSAQFPFHMWLPDFLYAPTPVTALLHAGIINAGGFLLARLAPLYDLSAMTLHLVFLVGGLTAVLGSSMMLVQTDIKKTLGYSTIGQMGFMLMECGLGAYGLAIFHLIAHGLFKGTIFLNCGSVIQAARKEPKLPHKQEPERAAGFSTLTWLTGFTTTLILPLVILLGAHGILRISLADSQGAAIFLFFGWATSAQAILTLYRLRAVASWKVAVTMLVTLFIVVTTYIFAEKRFTYFLFPAPGEVERHFMAGALPPAFFDLLVAGFALLIIFGWYLIYVPSHGRTVRLPTWVRHGQMRLYLLLLNRLYLDTVALRLGQSFRNLIRRLDDNRLFYYLASAAAVGMAIVSVPALPDFSLRQLASIVTATLLLPLFPFHWGYIGAVTRSSGYRAVMVAVLLPVMGLLVLANLAGDIPWQTLRALSVLALCSALYASLKALAQVNLRPLIAHGSMAFFALFWWRFGSAGNLSTDSLVYTLAITSLTGTFLWLALFLHRHYGELTLQRMHGLARPMPCFGILLAIWVMAALGVLPAGLFSSYLGMLLRPAVAISWELFVVVLTWFLASWYLFRMLQQLLFGPHRLDLSYTDLRPGQSITFVIVLAVIIALGLTPRHWLESHPLTHGLRATLETTPW